MALLIVKKSVHVEVPIYDEDIAEAEKTRVVGKLRRLATRLGASSENGVAVEMISQWLLGAVIPTTFTVLQKLRQALLELDKIDALKWERLHLKHGADGRGGPGPCPPDCRKCIIDQQLKELGEEP